MRCIVFTVWCAFEDIIVSRRGRSEIPRVQCSGRAVGAVAAVVQHFSVTKPYSRTFLTFEVQRNDAGKILTEIVYKRSVCDFVDRYGGDPVHYPDCTGKLRNKLSEAERFRIGDGCRDPCRRIVSRLGPAVALFSRVISLAVENIVVSYGTVGKRFPAAVRYDGLSRSVFVVDYELADKRGDSCSVRRISADVPASSEYCAERVFTGSYEVCHVVTLIHYSHVIL